MNTLWFGSLVAVALAVSAPAAAGEAGACHFHGNKVAAEAVVKDCAQQRHAALVKAGKLDASWASATPEAVEWVDGKKGKEWRVRIANPAAVDPAKRTLYLFFAPNGNFIAANFTGQ